MTVAPRVAVALERTLWACLLVRHRLFGPFSGRVLEVAVRRLLGT